MANDGSAGILREENHDGGVWWGEVVVVVVVGWREGGCDG